MLKRLWYSVLILVLLSVVISANAEMEEEPSKEFGQTLAASVQYFQIPEIDDARGAYAVCYVSEDEVWWGGPDWVARTDCNGEQQSYFHLTDIPFKDSSILCLAKIGNKLMMGFVDWDTGRSCIGVLTDGDASPTYYPLAGLVNAESFYAAQKGIMVVGTIPVKGKRSNKLWCTYVSSDGQVLFENTWQEDDWRGVQGYQYLRIRETQDGFIILSQRLMKDVPKSGVSFSMQCWTNELEPLWSFQFPDYVVSCNNIAVSENAIYIVGGTVTDGILDQYHYHASCIRYSLLGEEQEIRTLDMPISLFNCIASSDGFVSIGVKAGGGLIDHWYIMSEDQDHDWRNAVIQVEGDHTDRGYSYSKDGVLHLFGSHTISDLFIVSVTP